MSVDILQDKIRKTKNPFVLELAVSPDQLPPQFSRDGNGYAAFCREIMEELKGFVPAVRVSFGQFSLLGHDGLYQLSQTLNAARELGYYALLDAPELLSPGMAQQAAALLLGEDTLYPCDGLVIGGYLGSDVIKPFLPYCKKQKKDLFVVTRTANKSASELQDLLSGRRLVHGVLAEQLNVLGLDLAGKSGYSRLGALAGASSADSLRTLRERYPRMFLLLDGYDYPKSNAKNCALAFDKFGHGAAICTGREILCAWNKTESDGADHLAHAKAAAERLKKNLSRYITVL